MPTHLGSAAIDAAHLGASAVDKLYLGANAVYTALAPPSQVTGLAVDSTGDGTIDLSWTSPASDATITDYSVEYTDVQPLTGVALLAPFDSDLDDVLGITATATNTPTVTSGGQFGSYADLGAADKLAYSSVPFGSGDYTVEFWVKRTESTWAPNSGNPLLTLPGVAMIGRAGTDTLGLHEDDFGSWASVAGTTTASIDQAWHHIALVRDGSTLRFYLDGSQVGTMSTSVSPSSIELGASNIYGCRFGLDDLRVSTSAVYPSGTTFTPPTVAHPTSGGGTTSTVLVGSAATTYQLTGLTNDTEYSVRIAAVSAAGTGAYSTAVTGTPISAPSDPNFASVSLLAHFDGSGNTYVDSSSNANTIADSAYNGGGDTQSTAQSKFGGSSLLVSSSYAAAVQASNCAPSGTGDFTIEMWGYASSSSPYSRDMIATSTVLTATTFELEDRRLAVNGSTVLSFTAPPTGAWFHLALVRESNVWRVYRDGIELANGTNSTSLPTGQSLFIGGLPYYGSDGWLGSYIDEVRVTLGVVRYPGGTTFTPPTDAFPNS